jgi:hypothetical protein
VSPLSDPAISYWGSILTFPFLAIASIQAAGSAVFTADAEIKRVMESYATQVHQAMQQSPFDVGNDALFEEWKTVSRLSQSLAQIEAEMRNIYSAAQGLASKNLLVSPSSLALAGPGAAPAVTLLKPIEATDAVIKQPRKVSNNGGRAGNKSKLLSALQLLLNSESFTKVTHAQLCEAAAIPKGSVGASLAQLIQAGNVQQGDTGGLKLAAGSLIL